MVSATRRAASGPQAFTRRSIRAAYGAVVGLYLVAMIWVWAGIFYASGTAYIGYAGLLAIAFMGAAGLIFIFGIPVFGPIAQMDMGAAGHRTAVALVALVVALIGVHWLALGRIPIIAAFGTNSQMQAALIRDSIHQARIPFESYIPTLVVRSIVPFLAIYFIYHRRFGLSWVVMLIGLAYGLSLMQKSYPLLVLVPPGLYCLITRRPVRMAAILAIAVAAVLVAFVAASPRYRPLAFAPAMQTTNPQPHAPAPPKQPQTGPAPHRPGIAKMTGAGASALARRVFVLPGKVVADWFATFPARLPFEHGCGYRFVAPFVGCPFVNTPKRLYPLFYQRNAAAGVHGNYNAAHFAVEYANFGPPGLIVSGILAALVLAGAAITTERAGLAGVLALNFAPIMTLSSGALHTILLTGGWLLVMILTFAFFPPARPSETVAYQTSPLPA